MVRIFAGVEGGATASKAIIVDETGKILASIEDGGSTNFYLVGFDASFNQINDMLQRGKKAASLVESTIFDCLGLCLSGCEGDQEFRDNLSRKFTTAYPNVAKKIVCESDTYGSLLTVTKNGGIIVISGTGSNSMLINPNGQKKTCGGYGHILGDDGGAFWITKSAINAILDSDSNFVPTQHDTSKAREIILDYFKIKNISEIIGIVYPNFDKSYFAGACVHLAKGASEGDPLLKEIFFKAGKALAQHVYALSPSIDKRIFDSSEGLTIACIGSVFKSWPLLRDGFISGLRGSVPRFSLYTTKGHSAIGAIVLAALAVGHDIPVDFDLYRQQIDVPIFE